MFRKIPKDQKILELNIGQEFEDFIILSDYDIRLLKDLGIVDEDVKVDEKIYQVYRELYEKGYNPSIFLYNDKIYIKITSQKYLRHKPKYEYLVAFDMNLEFHLKAATATKLRLLIYLDGKYLMILPHTL